MGQIIQAVIYGCEPPAGVQLFDEGDVDNLGLVERWEAHILKGVKDNYWKARSLLVPDHDEGRMIGFWVAGVREDDNDSGERMAGAVDLAALAQTERAKRAVERWDRFAAWAAEQGVALAPGRLCLTSTEVA